MSLFVLVESNTTGSGRLFCTRAREVGLRPVVLARDPARYPYLRADQIDVRRVDTTSAAAVRTACAALGAPVAGITSSSEYFIASAAEAARSLGLPHPDPEAIRACRNKATQRAILLDAGLPGAAFATADTPTAAVEAAERIGLPVVVKPVTGSGSVATEACLDLAAVGRAARAVLDPDQCTPGLPPQDAVLVEEYLAGPEYSVETFDDRVVGITRKHLGPEPHFVEVGHDFPALPDRPTAISDTAVAALRALGLGWGPAHVELRRCLGGPPRMIEVNPRLAGGMIPRAVQEATGIDLIGHTVARATGNATSPVPIRCRVAAIRFLVAHCSGRLIEVTGMAEARRVPHVVEVGLTCEPGQDLVVRHSFQDRLGYVIATATDQPTAARAAEAGLRAVSAQIAAPSS